MQSHKTDGTEPTGGGRGPLLVGAAVVAVILIVVVLHVSGIIGANLHR
jgi:hypothetical protein